MLHYKQRFSAAFGLPGGPLDKFNIFVECFFGLDILLSNLTFHFFLDFFTEYISEEDFYSVRDLKKIAFRYLK